MREGGYMYPFCASCLSVANKMAFFCVVNISTSSHTNKPQLYYNKYNYNEDEVLFSHYTPLFSISMKGGI